MVKKEDKKREMIYTSYFGRMKKIPQDIIPISICGKAPEWYKGIEYKKLAPKYGFFIEWKRNKDNAFYIQHFREEVLNQLSITEVIEDLEKLSHGKSIVLLCYEKPKDFCHRHLVATWFNKNGIECAEWEE